MLWFICRLHLNKSQCLHIDDNKTKSVSWKNRIQTFLVHTTILSEMNGVKGQSTSCCTETQLEESGQDILAGLQRP